MLVRRESRGDVEAVGAVITAAFRRGSEAPEPPETELLERLRAHDGWLPRLSLVVVVDHAVVGHVVCTRGHVDDRPALGLGPIGVLPNHQRAGVGHALMRVRQPRGSRFRPQPVQRRGGGLCAARGGSRDGVVRV